MKLCTRPLLVVRLQRAAQRGFTLLEVLVAIIVLSFGLLGLVGLQAFSINNINDAKRQALALSFAREMAEMMRANAQVSALTANNPYLGEFAIGALRPQTSSDCLSVNKSCASAEQVAQANMTDWLARLDAALPAARVTICRDSAPYDANGQPRWACDNAGSIAVIKVGWARSTTNPDGDANNGIDHATVPYVVLPITPSGQDL